MSVRRPAVAGVFYRLDPEDLRKEIEGCFLHKLGPGRLPEVNPNGPRRIIGLVCPHAGYMYSGPVAAHAYYALAQDGVPDVVILLGPNHYGLGSPIAISCSEAWETPLGILNVDLDLAHKIAELSGIAELDDLAHLREHSIEVQLPFLQFLYGDRPRIVPISMMWQELEPCKLLGEAIAEAVKDLNAVIIASTDFTHYEPQESAERKDTAAIKKILTLDPQGLYEEFHRLGMSMCGLGPVLAMLFAARALGASAVHLLKYATSGDVTGDYSEVVGYASLAVTR